MPTLHDVAKLAGVAPITVSRVINNSGYASDATRKRVNTAIKKLKYEPNTLARSLRSQRTGMLALMIGDITLPLFTRIARGVEDTASAAGFSMILCNTDESEAKEEEYLNALLQKQVDGILLVPACTTPQSIRFIQAQGVAVVVLDRRLSGVSIDSVRGDSEGGAYRLIQMLLQLGHRQIAMLNGPAGISTSEDRAAGYRRALEAAGISHAAELVYHGDFNQTSGYAMTQQALRAPVRPTALFAANNYIAMGAMHALHDAGLRVPEDMALVAFDDLPSVMVASPFLTVAAQPAHEMAKVATKLLLAQLAGSKERQEIVLPTEIVVRRSSGGPLNVRQA